MVYRNNMKSEYGDYLFEPIKLREMDNSPYLNSQQQLSYQVSNPSFHKDLSKKSIESTSPIKKDKMSQYMQSTPYDFRQADKLNDFKRKVNYFWYDILLKIDYHFLIDDFLFRFVSLRSEYSETLRQRGHFLLRRRINSQSLQLMRCLHCTM